MSRMYSAIFEEVAVSAAQDFFEINAPADAVVILHALELSQSSDTDNENLSLIIHRGTDSGSGGTVATARPMEVGDPAFGGTIEVNNTTESTEGVILHAAAFSVLAGYTYLWTPETRIEISPSGRLNITLQTVPADALTMSGTIYFEEVGG